MPDERSDGLLALDVGGGGRGGGSAYGVGRSRAATTASGALSFFSSAMLL
jgi:hypothetical protein